MQLQQFAAAAALALLFGYFLMRGVVRRKAKGINEMKPVIGLDGPMIGPGGGGGFSSDVIVVGAGVTGSALAYTLGKDGRRVRVIERDLTEPDRIVGELLQPGGYLKLIELGLEDCLEEIDAQRVIGYALFKDGKSTKVSYPLGSFHADVAGRSFHHGRFVQRMREKAASLRK